MSRYVKADKLIGFDHETDKDVMFAKSESEIFWEHGLTPKLALVGSTVFQTVDYISSTGRDIYSGLGNSQLGLRYQIYQKDRWVAALQPSLILAGNGETIADADLGNGSHALELRGLFGGSSELAHRKVFFDGQISMILSTGGYIRSYGAEITGGYDVSNKGMAMVQIFYNNGTERYTESDIILSSGAMKLQASYVYRLKSGRSMQIGAFQTVLGRNIVKERGLVIGLWQPY